MYPLSVVASCFRTVSYCCYVSLSCIIRILIQRVSFLSHRCRSFSSWHSKFRQCPPSSCRRHQSRTRPCQTLPLPSAHPHLLRSRPVLRLYSALPPSSPSCSRSSLLSSRLRLLSCKQMQFQENLPILLLLPGNFHFSSPSLSVMTYNRVDHVYRAAFEEACSGSHCLAVVGPHCWDVVEPGLPKFLLSELALCRLGLYH